MRTIRESVKLTNAGAAINKLKHERDTYRELCAELLGAMFKINDINNQIEIGQILEVSIDNTKAILGDKLGDKNGTSN